MSVITRKVGKVPVRFGKSRLMTTSVAQIAAEGTGVQPNGPVPLHPNNVSEGGGDRDGGHVEQI